MLRSALLPLAVILAAVVQPSFAQSFYTDCSENTGNSAVIIVSADIDPWANGGALPANSEIAVFTPEGICAGAAVWTGSNLSVTAWGDDGQTDAKDGFADGDTIAYRVWNSSNSFEYSTDDGSLTLSYDGSQPYYTTDGLYAGDAIYALSSLVGELAPDSPTLGSPADGASAVSTSPTLSWNAASGAETYRVQVATASDFSALVANQDGLTATSYEPADLEYGTAYFWRVRAVNGDGASAWSGTRSFTTEDAPTEPPAAPTLASPSDGATGVSTTPTLSWNAASGAETYRVQVATASDFSAFVANQDGLTATSYDPADLEYGTAYFWRVRAVNGDGASAWSGTRSFTTEDAPTEPPAAPTLSSPSDGATGVSTTPTLSWNADSGATTYRVQVSTASDFSALVANQDGLTTTSYDPADLEYGTVYYWRVRAVNGDGASAWSGIRSFTTEDAPTEPPAAPTLASPSDGASGMSTSPTLSWNAASGAETYRVQVSTDETFSTLVANQDGVTTTSYDATELEYSTDYHWRVRAINTDGSSEWSGARSFTTNSATLKPPAAPTLGLPAAGASQVSTHTTLSWYASSGATTYRVQLSTSVDFSALIVNQGGLTTTSLTAESLGNATTYYWRVRANNDDGASAWSPVRSFTTENLPQDPPSAPELIAPNDGASGISRTPTLSWNAASGAASYRVQMATNSNFSALVADQEGLSSTSYESPGLELGTTYYWRVLAANSEGSSSWSGTRSFNTETAQTQPPAAPTPASPAAGASQVSTSPTLSWYAGSGATNYRVQVSTAADFSAFVVNLGGLTTLSYDVDDLEYGTTYYWRVRSINSGGNSAWTDVRSFTTEAAPSTQPPPAPTLASPANGAADVSPTPTLSWNAATGAETYRVQISAASNFSTLIDEKSGLSATSYTVADLGFGTTYYWRVRSANAKGSSSWSGTRSFTTASDGTLHPPAPTWPTDEATDVPSPVLLQWSDVSGASIYRVQVSITEDFRNVVLESRKSKTEVLVVLANEQAFFWRVRAETDSESSPWSAARTFTTACPPPPAPRVEWPAGNGELASSDATLAWQPVEDATNYQVQVSRENADGTSDVVVDTTSAATTEVTLQLDPHATYSWRVRAENAGGWGDWSDSIVFSTGASTSAKDPDEEPKHVRLHQNYPNPFNPETTIPFELPKTSRVKLTIYTMLGQEVVTLVSGSLPGGTHDVRWDAHDMPSGVYAYVLETERSRKTRTLLLMK